MDVRHIDETDPQVSLDLLRQWSSAAFRRTVPSAVPLGCPWSALTSALRSAGFEYPEDELERYLREVLVDTYVEQGAPMVKTIIKAKGQYSSVFLQMLGPDPDRARVFWVWYLYCLGICTSEPLEPGAARMSLDMVDLQVLASRLNVVVIVSHFLQPAIRLEPAGVGNGGGGGEATRIVRLVHHRGLWAPMLDVKAPPQEVARLVGTLVPVDRGLWMKIADLRQSPTHCEIGLVTRYDAERDAYEIDLGGPCVLAARHEFGTIIHDTRDMPKERPLFATKRTLGRRKAEDGLHRNRHLSGILPETLEWQILHELVRRQVRSKLARMQCELAGREFLDSSAAAAAAGECGATGSRMKEPVPDVREMAPASEPEPDVVPTAAAPPAAAHSKIPVGAAQPLGPPAYPPTESAGGVAARPQPAKSFVGSATPHDLGVEIHSHAPFAALAKGIGAGSAISVYALRKNSPSQGGFLPLQVGDVVRILDINDRGWLYCASVCPAGGARLGVPSRGWVPQDCFILWVTRQVLELPEHLEKIQFLRLDVGQAVVVNRRYEGDWAGWAFGVRWGGEQQDEGVFNLSYSEPLVIVRSVT